jgi:hypothetical protein
VEITVLDRRRALPRGTKVWRALSQRHDALLGCLAVAAEPRQHPSKIVWHFLHSAAMSRDRAERVALTEAAFRIANERMADWEERRNADGAVASYYCECAVEGCREEVRLSRAEYEAVRSEPRHFVVLHGHIIEDLETEIERHETYSVIEKPAALAPLLTDADPRSEPAGPARHEASKLADEIAPVDD